MVVTSMAEAEAFIPSAGEVLETGDLDVDWHLSGIERQT